MANKHRSASALIGAHNALLLQLLLVLQKKEVLGGDEVDAIFAQARQQLEGRPATVQDASEHLDSLWELVQEDREEPAAS